MYFDGVKKNFGFGFMRLPMKDKEVDYEELNKMVDTFLENGFNYFDTAHGYVEKKSEIAIRESLAKRYKRESFILTNKLTNFFFTKQEDIRPFFESQLEACGVDYFDFYLMHAQSKENFAFFKKCHAYETALEFKKEGKIKHFGISFHDTADVLDQILSEYPQIEVVQIQLNYVDFDDAAVQSRKCYEVCRKYNKPVIIMEPVKGGNLVNLPSDAQKIFDDLHGGSNASYAIRFAAGFDGVFMVLSGMSNMEQMLDNISYMKDFKPLNEKEKEAIDKVCDVFKNMHLIACTACRYCVAGCPKHISIPDLFSCMNTKNIYHDWNANYYYSNVHTKFGGKASDCIECGKCESACPQHLPIRKLLKAVAKEFEG
ncbi:MAG: aldo/keto reductase [Anaeroplasmataceae bacterium]|nr:aldo/keto reductase [Anaeroplasmataceae bacterium]